MRQQTVRDIDRPISLVLMIGMLISIVLVLVGVVLLLSRGGFGVPRPLPPVQAAHAALGLRADGWLSLGVFVLILTPVARVLMAVGSFAWIRDWKYASVSAVVLAAMAAAFIIDS
jgi:uncharacterized membrane protein